MAAVFGAWSQPGGKGAPFVFEESQVRKYSRKYKHGKHVGRREVVEKFKALSMHHESAFSPVQRCPYCLWLEDLLGGEDDEDIDDAEFWGRWYDDCELPCRGNERNVKVVYTINRQAFLVHARVVGHEYKDSKSHRSSKQKRREAKKNGREALRDFEAHE